MTNSPPADSQSQVRNVLRRMVHRLRPVTRYFLLWRDLRRLRGMVERSNVPEELVRHLGRSALLKPTQIPGEITRMLEILGESPPARVCEIGALNGGTTILLLRVSAEDARVATIDMKPRFHLRWALSHARKSRQQVFVLEGNSQTPAMVERVRRDMDNEPLDLLFIDGDHSYAGVKRDFLLYAPLVRPGGLIVFHDIMPDSRWRGELSHTPASSGEVPIFWLKLRTHYDTQEIVAHEDQHGFGLGVVRWPGADGIERAANI